MHIVSVATEVSVVHRLYRAAGRSRLLHGHTWTVTVDIGTHCLSENGMVVEFAPIKTRIREQLARHVDRHVLLARDDPAAAAVNTVAELLVFDGAPTAEALAQHLFGIFMAVVAELMGERAKYLKVTVCEAYRLTASYDGL